MTDAIIVGAGPNGLVAANLLLDAGWSVIVLEEQSTPGGSVRSAELIEPGFVNDLFSAFYPLAAASPVMRSLELERHGLRWCRAAGAVAHPRRDGSCALLSTDLERTARSLEAFAPGDGDAWRQLYGLWERVGPPLLDLLFNPFPPAGPATRLAARLGPAGLLRFLRLGLQSVRRLGEETFAGDGGRRLLAGNALHADFSPELPPSAIYGWLLCSLGQQLGFPVPAGGSGRLAEALVRRLEARGGQVLCGRRATRIERRGGRAAAVRTLEGERYEASRAVIADVGAPQLYEQLLDPAELSGAQRADLSRFEYDSSTVKLDWTLDGPIPWTAEDVRSAGTVHVAEGVDALTKQASELTRGLIPETPYLVLGQYAALDGTRAPAGRETAWAYTHLPQTIAGDAAGQLTGSWDERETARFVERIEDEVEALAPGFRALIRGRHVFTPAAMEAANRNLVGGALGGGTSQLHQQLLFRPALSLARPETPVPGLYLASASAHPGGGVHGACGSNAARAALAARRPAGRLIGALARRTQR